MMRVIKGGVIVIEILKSKEIIVFFVLVLGLMFVVDFHYQSDTSINLNENLSYTNIIYVEETEETEITHFVE